jgi:hypothetical protein
MRKWKKAVTAAVYLGAELLDLGLGHGNGARVAQQGHIAVRLRVVLLATTRRQRGTKVSALARQCQEVPWRSGCARQSFAAAS